MFGESIRFAWLLLLIAAVVVYTPFVGGQGGDD